VKRLRLGLSPDVHLAMIRIAVFVVWAWQIVTYRAGSLADLPREIVRPPGLFDNAALQALYGSGVALELLRWGTVALCVAAAAAVRPFAPIAVAAVAGIVVTYGAMQSIGGYVNHAQQNVLWIAVLLVAAPCADRLSMSGPPPDSARSRDHATTVTLIALLVAATYAMTGLRRVGVGGVSVFTGESMKIWVTARSLQYSAFPLDVGLVVLRSRAIERLLQVGLLVSTVFEIASPLAVCWRRFRWVWIAVMVGFHVGVLFMMRIIFWENIVLILVVFAPLAIPRPADPETAPDLVVAEEAPRWS